MGNVNEIHVYFQFILMIFKARYSFYCNFLGFRKKKKTAKEPLGVRVEDYIFLLTAFLEIPHSECYKITTDV